MTENDAHAIAAWRYDGIYAFYDAVADQQDLAELLDPAQWGTQYFAADAGQELVGFFVFKLGPDAVAEVGLGLRPDLTGQGPAETFLTLTTIPVERAASANPARHIRHGLERRSRCAPTRRRPAAASPTAEPRVLAVIATP